MALTRCIRCTHPAAACASPYDLLGYAPAAHTLSWDGCLASDTVLTWFGVRCGADYRSIQWTGVFAAEYRSGAPKSGCDISAAASKNYKLKSDGGNTLFGGCGVAPTAAPG